jgi:hypothetical protein
MAALLKELEGYDYKIYMSWDKFIPDSHNYLADRALADGADYILFLEEDVVMPEGSLEKMLGKGDIVALDYGVAGWSCITTFQGENMWCGLGCTLIKREVFEVLEAPYFRSDKGLLLNVWPEIKWVDMSEQNYGGHDIYFGMKAREKGFKILKADGEARHLKLEALGTKEINKGLHRVVDKPVISQHNKL